MFELSLTIHLEPFEEIGRAGSGNRTRMASLEDWNFTIKLYPQSAANLPRLTTVLKRVFFNSQAVAGLISKIRSFVPDSPIARASLCGPASSGSLRPPILRLFTCSATIP